MIKSVPKPVTEDSSKQERRVPANGRAAPKPDTEDSSKQEQKPAKTPPAKPRKKGKLFKIALFAAGVAIAGGGSWFFFQSSQTTETRPQVAQPPVFVPLDTFTVNLQRDEVHGTDQYLQVGLALKVEEQAVGDAIKLRMPEIRNKILLLLSSKRASDIVSVEGKQKLSADIMAESNKTIVPASGPNGIVGVYFTAFVIQ